MQTIVEVVDIFPLFLVYEDNMMKYLHCLMYIEKSRLFIQMKSFT